jgi:hypothetical protein
MGVRYRDTSMIWRRQRGRMGDGGWFSCGVFMGVGYVWEVGGHGGKMCYDWGEMQG